ncbi:MAG: NAD(P)H-binding protein [Acidimicrobiales bacterium]
MARVTVVGGHGKVALLATPLLVADGHQVTSIIRSEDQATEIRELGATPLVADMESMNTAAMAERFRGAEVIVWSAGAGGGNPSRTEAVDRDAAIRSMAAAADAGVPRYVMISYLGAGPDHGVPEGDSFHPYAEAKAAADAALRASPLSWTILMPSRLTDAPGTGRIDDGSGPSASVTRADVAEVVRRVVAAEPATVAGQDIPFNNGELAIMDVIGR